MRNLIHRHALDAVLRPAGRTHVRPQTRGTTRQIGLNECIQRPERAPHRDASRTEERKRRGAYRGRHVCWSRIVPDEQCALGQKPVDDTERLPSANHEASGRPAPGRNLIDQIDLARPRGEDHIEAELPRKKIRDRGKALGGPLLRIAPATGMQERDPPVGSTSFEEVARPFAISCIDGEVRHTMGHRDTDMVEQPIIEVDHVLRDLLCSIHANEVGRDHSTPKPVAPASSANRGVVGDLVRDTTPRAGKSDDGRRTLVTSQIEGEIESLAENAPQKTPPQSQAVPDGTTDRQLDDLVDPRTRSQNLMVAVVDDDHDAGRWPCFTKVVQKGLQQHEVADVAAAHDEDPSWRCESLRRKHSMLVHEPAHASQSGPISTRDRLDRLLGLG